MNLTLKQVLEYYKNKNFKIIDDNINSRITAVELETGIIYTSNTYGHFLICFRKDSDVRFSGVIENIVQLKLIDKLIRLGLPIK